MLTAEQERLKHLWDLKNVVSTAFKDGMQLILEIIQLYTQENTINTIADKVGKSTAFVKKILQDAGFQA